MLSQLKFQKYCCGTWQLAPEFYSKVQRAKNSKVTLTKEEQGKNICSIGFKGLFSSMPYTKWISCEAMKPLEDNTWEYNYDFRSGDIHNQEIPCIKQKEKEW